jgi:hypothetical protein
LRSAATGSALVRPRRGRDGRIYLRLHGQLLLDARRQSLSGCIWRRRWLHHHTRFCHASQVPRQAH